MSILFRSLSDTTLQDRMEEIVVVVLKCLSVELSLDTFGTGAEFFCSFRHSALVLDSDTSALRSA